LIFSIEAVFFYEEEHFPVFDVLRAVSSSDIRSLVLFKTCPLMQSAYP